ncbi:MAG TPA: CotH kinase family protein [Flavobacterium sp.]|jgi:hypothetical protein
MNLKITSFLLLLSFWGYSQHGSAQKQFNQIPIAFQSHPELGQTTHSASLHEVDYELVQNRTKYSRTFLNTNKTKTTVQSSVPLHYQDNNGLWRSIDYKLSRTNNKIMYPAQNPFVELDSDQTSVTIANQRVNINAQSNFVFIAEGNEVSKKTTIQKDAVLEEDNKVVFNNISAGIDKKITFYQEALKIDYLINNADILPQHFDYMVVEEVIDLPSGFSIQEEKLNGNITNRLLIADHKGEEVLVFQQPVISDSKVSGRNIRQQPYEARYSLIKLTQNSYKIQIRIDGSWLKSTERVYPINIDPVVTISNNNVVNSCLLPSYQQATLQVAVPAGETILSSEISYDFVAVEGPGSWMADQRSFVSGPNGQTPVNNGIGDDSGLYTYNLTNSSIANVVSTGQINFTFNFSRTWGGSGCNATYNFVNRREVAVTYGSIEFGNGPLLINEYCASNRNFNDGFGRNEDWIELYNSSPDTYFNLTGYHLSNNINNPTKWQIQDGVIPPNSRVLIFCSSRDISSGTVLHANFDLTQTDPDEIVLADPSGNIIESHEMFTTQTNHSYGRTSDGASTWSVFTAPTPGQPNVNGFSDYSNKPSFSVAPGRYSGAISVALSSDGPNEQIRYTTNGSTPTISSTLYTGPISITQSTVVRARTFSTATNILPGFIETNTYFINENSTLPVFSISGDPDLLQLLNGNAGLIPTGYVEYFEDDGTFIDENMGDFDAHGNDSWAYNQRGVDFVSRDDHGYKRRLQHQFFNTTDRTNFRRLILKAAGSDNYPHQSGGAHIRDAFVQTLSHTSDLELDERSCTFISLFVNGQYWGVYDLREKVDDNQYTDYYYGQDYTYRDSDNYIQYIKTWGSTEAEFGNQPALDAWESLTDFVQNNNMAAEANYNYVDSQLNIDSLIDYFVINSYMVNKDWLNWNTSWWRGLDPAGGAQKWRYALWDTDGVLGHYINYTGIPDISANAEPCNVENLEVGVGHTQTIQKLIEESPIVRQRYITRYADLLNTHLSCENATAVFDSIVAVIAPEMPRQIQRWGGSLAVWQANVLAARNFLLTRCSQTISTGLTECYDVTGPFGATFEVEPATAGKIRMNSEWIVNYPFTAQVFGNIETMLKAEPNAGYEFDHWVVDGAVILPDANNPDIVLQISQATSVTAHFTELMNTEDVIYYWHFNTLETPTDVVTIPADYIHVAGAEPLMTYTGTGPSDIDTNNIGSAINLHLDQSSGKCARVRNPSDGRPLVFDLPTTGYKDIKFAYAVQRTEQGMLTNHLSYSVDGVNFIQADLDQSTFNVTTDFSFVNADFSSITAVNDNPNFKIRITFEGNTTADNGNNRFDNVTLKGVEYNLSSPSQILTTYQVFPNPFKNNIQIISSEQVTGLSIYDMLGKKISEKTNVNKNSETMDLSALNAGIYLLKIKTLNGLITHKLIKQ